MNYNLTKVIHLLLSPHHPPTRARYGGTSCQLKIWPICTCVCLPMFSLVQNLEVSIRIRSKVPTISWSCSVEYNVALTGIISKVHIDFWPCVPVAPECVEIYSTFQPTCGDTSFLAPSAVASKLFTDSDIHTCEQAFVASTKTHFRAKVVNVLSETYSRVMTVYVTGYGLRCSPVVGIKVNIIPSCQLTGACEAPITCSSTSEIFLHSGLVRCAALCNVSKVEWELALVDIKREPGVDIDYDAWQICDIAFKV